MIQYFFKDDFDAENCAAFQRIVDSYPDLRFFQPSPQKAPWHVQCILADDIELNFWPHKLKGQRRHLPSVEGAHAIFEIIDEAISDAIAGPFDVIEDC